MKTGLQLYTLREYLQSVEGIKSTIKRVADIGYDAVQLACLAPMDFKELKDFCDGVGIEIIAADIGCDELLQTPEKVAEHYDILGCDYLVIGAPDGKYLDTPDHCKKLCEDLSVMSERLAKVGKTFCYHNHGFEFSAHDDGFVFMDYLLKNLSEKAQFLPDTYWIQYSGNNPAQHLKKIAGRIDMVHFKDMAINEKGETYMVPVMDGVLDWPEIISTCKAGGAKYAVVEQDSCVGDAFECVEKSYNNLKNKGDL